MTWGGVESVIDLDSGLPVADWSVISRSGADYSKSFEVPEPATLLMLIVTAPECSRAGAGARAECQNSSTRDTLQQTTV
jgi:hypothetical protein